jgi:hypothetical protein
VSEATRWSEDYARIMTDVIGDLRSRTPVQKIWLVGTSSGTTCTATIFDKPSRLPSINVPVYVAADRDDACPCSPPARSGEILKPLAMTPARASGLFPPEGSKSPPGTGTNPCSANTPHGFYGIEDDVVAAIVGWIKAH